MDIDDDEEDMGIDQSYANGDKIMKNLFASFFYTALVFDLSCGVTLMAVKKTSLVLVYRVGIKSPSHRPGIYRLASLIRGKGVII
jgi:hypothetical protein